jgi:hypothetical protein
MDEQHDSQRIHFDDQATKLAERRKFWIDMNFDSFEKLCRQQKLLSSPDGSQEPRNECYEVALTLYRIVHNEQSGPAELVLSYLKRLEDLRNANILVSADRFLKERLNGRMPELPRGPSDLADFLLYNKHCMMWQSISELFVKCRDSALDGDETEAFNSAFQASSRLSEFRTICSNEASRDKLSTKVERIWQMGNVTKAEVTAWESKSDEDQRWKARALENIETYLEPLLAEMRSSFHSDEGSEVVTVASSTKTL